MGDKFLKLIQPELDQARSDATTRIIVNMLRKNTPVSYIVDVSETTQSVIEDIAARINVKPNYGTATIS